MSFSSFLPRVAASSFFSSGFSAAVPALLASAVTGSISFWRAAAEQVAALLGPRAAGVFDKATMHVPIATAREACEYAARIGQVFIAVTLGVLFAGVFSAALAAWVERWNFIVDFLTSLLSSFL